MHHAPRPLRYTFILILAALATVLAAVGGWRFARASAPVNGPILLISIDTLRADHLPAYGYRQIKTPAIDALAADGVVFERAYSHAPQTLPAHVSMLSGRLPFETDVRDEGVAVKQGERLLPQLLRDRGFTTGGVVSSSLLGRQTGLSRGFDFFDADLGNGLRRDGADSEAIAEHWLNSVGTSRTFLFLHLDEPRMPYAEHLESGSASATYDSEIAYADEIVGRLVKYLKAHQLYDRSTIVLLSDHGEGLGDHGEREHGLFLYEEVVHVPLIVKQPAGIAAGTRVGDLVQHIDLVPTILELVKAPTPGHLRGRSLRPLLDGSGRLSKQPVYSEALYGNRHFGWSPLAAITDGAYAYISAPREELYDLRRDPRERENAAADRLRERQTLSAALDRVIATAPTPEAGRPYVGRRAYVGRRFSGAVAPIDPKDTYEIVETYRAAAELAASRKWAQANHLLQAIIKQDEGIAEIWNQLAANAMRIERFELAAEAYGRASELEPANVHGYLGASAALLRLRRFDEARDHAVSAAEIAGERDVRSRSAAHELLARIALARHDADGAREEADLARQADPKRPVSIFISARLLYDQGKYDEAAPLFEQAVEALARARGEAIADLHFYTADTLARLDRLEEAQAHYVEELREFPQNVRASAALATLAQSTGASAEASRVLTEMLDETPTPETYALAARLWTTFGDSRQAAATRAEARKAFTEQR